MLDNDVHAQLQVSRPGLPTQKMKAPKGSTVETPTVGASKPASHTAKKVAPVKAKTKVQPLSFISITALTQVDCFTTNKLQNCGPVIQYI
jgi:hypothetical protein